MLLSYINGKKKRWQCLLIPLALTVYCQLCMLRGSVVGGIVLEENIAEITSFIRHMGFHEDESGFNLKETTAHLQKEGLGT